MTYKRIIVICLVVSCFYGKTSITSDTHIQPSKDAVVSPITPVIHEQMHNTGTCHDEHTIENSTAPIEDEDSPQQEYESSLIDTTPEFKSVITRGGMRNVEFEDDLYILRDLVTREQKQHFNSFNELDVIIEAVKMHHCPRGQTIKVTIKNNHWKIAIKNIPQDLLIDCVPVPDLLARKTCKSWLDRYTNAVSHYIAKAMIYIWGKTLAARAKCSVVIHSNVHPDPEKEDFQCSEIILDVVELAEQDKIDIQKNWKSPLNIELAISKK